MTEITKLAISTSIFGLKQDDSLLPFHIEEVQNLAVQSRNGSSKVSRSQTLPMTLLWSVLGLSPPDPQWLLDFNPSHLHPSQAEKRRKKGTPLSFEGYFYVVFTQFSLPKPAERGVRNRDLQYCVSKEEKENGWKTQSNSHFCLILFLLNTCG